MTTRFRIRRGALALLVASSCLLAVQGTATAAAPTAHAAKACSAPDYPGSGYFNALRVSGTSCGTGRAVARAHYSCRTAHGKRGRCHHKVKGYRCKERRPASARIPTQYSARVKCKRGGRRVSFVYQQNT